jgi:hypothetical protein
MRRGNPPDAVHRSPPYGREEISHRPKEATVTQPAIAIDPVQFLAALALAGLAVAALGLAVAGALAARERLTARLRPRASHLPTAAAR